MKYKIVRLSWYHSKLPLTSMGEFPEVEALRIVPPTGTKTSNRIEAFFLIFGPHEKRKEFVKSLDDSIGDETSLVGGNIIDADENVHIWKSTMKLNEKSVLYYLKDLPLQVITQKPFHKESEGKTYNDHWFLIQKRNTNRDIEGVARELSANLEEAGLIKGEADIEKLDPIELIWDIMLDPLADKKSGLNVLLSKGQYKNPLEAIGSITMNYAENLDKLLQVVREQ